MTAEDLTQMFAKASQEGLYRHSSVMKPILLVISGLLLLCVSAMPTIKAQEAP